MSWKRSVERRLRPHVSGAAHQGYIDRYLRGWQHGRNLPRLREIRARVGPENLLRFPQSIR